MSLPDRLSDLWRRYWANTFPKEAVHEELFEIIVQLLSVDPANTASAFASMTNVLARRLAWGESEARVLQCADELAVTLVQGAQTHLADPEEQFLVIEAVGQVMTSLARDLALGVVSHAEHLRAECHRLEQIERRLKAQLA